MTAIIRKAARVEIPVLIVGETGTGKDLIAQEIHARSPRSDGPFVPVNMGMLTKDMVYSELFGHRKGSFTGATENKAGRFLEAQRGSLFLDEISTMGEQTQVDLLRVIETREFRPLGAKSDVQVDVRVIAAMNEDPDDVVEESRFREDLMYRLAVLRIDTIPLRETKEDIPLLAEHFLRSACVDLELSDRKFSQEACDALVAYPWPGNMRELKNMVAQSAIMNESEEISLGDLPQHIRDHEDHLENINIPAPSGGVPDTKPAAADPVPASSPDGHEGIFLPLGNTLDEVQKAYILKTLTHNGNNKTKAAKSLGMSRKTLYDRLSRWKIQL